MSVYELIEKCEDTVKIPWRYILKEHEKETMKFLTKNNSKGG